MHRFPAGLALLVTIASCGGSGSDGGAGRPLDTIATEYLVLELSVGLHDAGHVDAYFGPEALQAEAANAALSPAQILSRVEMLEAELLARTAETPGHKARIDGLLARLHATATRIRLARGEALTFDEESERLFGAKAPDYDASRFDAVLAKIDALLPGEARLAERVDAFQSDFRIPPGKLAAVFDAAIAECRRRTLQHIQLPPEETFRIEYVTDKPWSGYNWFQGGARSLIQINTDLPIFISRAVDLGCHEGYPGHHTFNTLLEEHLVYGEGWIEFSLYPLFSPQSLIAEGSGNYGIDIAFPGDERIVFEKNVLFPLAGLDAAEAGRYYELLDLLAELDYAGNEAARDYINGEIDRDAAVRWLIDYTLVSEERARQRMDFIDTYRSYVINYNLGRDRVARWVEQDSEGMAERWEKFEELLSTPKLPVDIDR